MATLFEREMATYRRELPTLLADRDNIGRFVVIHGDDVIGLYRDIDTAYDVGEERFDDDEQFMIRQVLEFEPPPVYFSRNLPGCP